MIKKQGALLCLGVIACLLVAFSLRPGAYTLSYDVSQLLPTANMPNTLTPVAQFTRNVIDNRILLLVNGTDRNKLHKVTSKLSEQLQASGHFRTVLSKIEPDFFETVNQFYAPYRYQLESPKDQQLPTRQYAQMLIQSAWLELSIPLKPLSSQQFINDPLFNLQRFVRSLPRGANNIKPDQGFLEVYQNGRYYTLIVAVFKGKLLSLENQKTIVDTIDKATQIALEKKNAIFGTDEKAMTVLRSGQLFHTLANTQTPVSETQAMGVIIALAIVTLMLLIFHSFIPLALTIVAVSTGVLSGFATTQMLLGPINVFTLLFCLCLIGASADYTYFFSRHWQRQQKRLSVLNGAKRILPVILLGVMVGAIASPSWLANNFSELRQIAVFATVGIMVTRFTLFATSPLMVRFNYPEPDNDNVLFLLARATDRLWTKVITGYKRYALLVLLIAMTAGITQLTTNDSLHYLLKAVPELKKADDTTHDLLGDFTETRFFLVQGSSMQALLEREEALVNVLQQQVSKGNLTNYQAVSEFLPSIHQQQANYEKLRSIYRDDLTTYFDELGIKTKDRTAIIAAIDSEANQQLTVEKWLSGPLFKTHGHTWLGFIEGSFYSAVLLSGISPDWNLAELENTLEGVTFINHDSTTAAFFSHYRVVLSVLIAIAIGLTAIFFLVSYGFKKAFSMILPPLLSVLLTLSLLAVQGFSISMVTITALIIVLGTSTGYSLLLHQFDHHKPVAHATMTLSVLMILITFGFLSFSTIPLLSNFGHTLLTGMIIAYLLAPIAWGSNSEQ